MLMLKPFLLFTPTLTKRIALMLAIVSMPCLAQLPEEFKTQGGEWTGYYWRSLSNNEKLAFVLGYQAGYLDAAPSNESVRGK
jgi:hypothetical protein